MTFFGSWVRATRMAQGVTQKDLAARIRRKDGRGAISAQYLNDIEHGRREPTDDKIIRQFARALGAPEEFLFVLAGKIPDAVRRQARDPERVAAAFRAFAAAVAAPPPQRRTRRRGKSGDVEGEMRGEIAPEPQNP